MIARHPVDTGDYPRRCARAGAIEDAHGDEPHVLRDAVRRATNGAGDVCAVTVAIGGVPASRDFIDARHRAPTKLDVIEANTRVDDVRRHAGASRYIRVSTVERERPLIDAIEAPCGI